MYRYKRQIIGIGKDKDTGTRDDNAQIQLRKGVLKHVQLQIRVHY